MRRLPLIVVALWALAAPALAAGPLDELRRAFALGGKPVPPTSSATSAPPTSPTRCRRSSRSTSRRRSNSNRYGDPIVRNGDWVEQSRPAEGSLNGAEETGYRFIGVTKNGLLIVVAYYSGGGTGVFYSLYVLDASLAAGFDGDGKPYRRVDLTLLRSVALGDRWQGDVSIAGDTLRIATVKTPAEGVPKAIEARRP